MGSAPDERPNEPKLRAHRTGRLGIVLAAAFTLILGGWSLAFEPVAGAEFLLSDAGGTMLVGYGRLGDQGLEIRLADDTEQMRIIVVSPDGSADSYRGVLRDGRLELVSEDGAHFDLADSLAGQDLSLTLTWSDGAAAVVPPSDAAATDAEASSNSPNLPSETDASETDASETDASDPEAGGSGETAEDPEAPGRSSDAPGRSDGTDGPGRSDPPGRPDSPGRSDPPGLDGRDLPPGRNLTVNPDLFGEGHDDASTDEGDADGATELGEWEAP